MAQFIFIDEVTSTSTYARKNLSQFADFSVISANYQTESYGQFGRKWLSSRENGGNCYLSIVLKPQNITHLSELTQFTSLYAAKTLEEYGLAPYIKYPNDVLVNDKKIAGILAESVFVGSTFKGVIVGVGVNLNLQDAEIQTLDVPATSVFAETGKNVDKEEFIEKFLNNFKASYDDFLENGMPSNKTEILYQSA